RKRGGSDSSTTPPTAVASPRPITTIATAPRLTAAKGKQPARATSPTEPSEVERIEAEQLKIILRRSRQETHISQHSGFSTDEGTGSKPGALVDAYEADKTILESYGDTTILKRRRGDDDDQEGPFAGSDRGSKRRREDYLLDGRTPTSDA
nr:hypothetical protein [Tanacetum cinerariifolium]